MTIERMKDHLSADFFELPQEWVVWRAVFALDDHILIRLTEKIRINKNDLACAEEGLHGIVFHLYGEGALPWNVCFKQRFSVNETRRLFGCDHLVNLIPSQERHFPQRAEGGGMGVSWEFE